MATATTELEVVISAKDEATAKLKDIQKSAGEIGKSFAVAGAAIVGALGYAVKQATDAQTTIASLDATLRTMGEGALKQREAILQASEAAVRLGFDDEQAAVSIGRLYQRTGDLTKAVQLNALAMDIAAYKHIDLETASKAVNMALTGSGRLFKELGIATKDAGTPMELLAEAQSKVSGQAAAFANTVPGQLAVLKESFNNLAQGVGEVLLPIISKVLSQLTPLIEKMMNWAETHPKLVENIVLATAAIGGLLAVLAPILIIFSAISAPMLLAGAAIGALTLAIFWLIQNWQAVKAALEPFLVQLEYLWSLAVEFLKPALDALILVLMMLWTQLKALWDLIAPYLMPLLKAFGIMVGVTLVVAIGLLIVAVLAIAGTISVFIDWLIKLGDWLGNIYYWVSTTLVSGLATLKSAWENTWNSMNSVISNVVNSIQSKIDAVIAAWNRAQAMISAPLVAATNVIKGAVSNVVGAVTGKRAGGGEVAGGKTYLVGERGAELFTPQSNGYITPNRALAGGGNITININGGTYLSERAAIEIGNMIANRLKMVSKLRV